MMSVRITNAEIFIHNIHTRIPFRFGITELNSVPHMFMKLTVDFDGVEQVGVSADTLIQKWFTKDPSAEMEDEISDLLTVVQHAANAGMDIGKVNSAFDLWLQLYNEQLYWGENHDYAPLLANFGTTVIERALIDAVCRVNNLSFRDVLQADLLGIDPTSVYQELEHYPISQVLESKPQDELFIRHTVGLSDPIYKSDIRDDQRVMDGLPHSLEENIEIYQLRYFKIKVNGDFERDYERIHQVASLFNQMNLTDYWFTLDGNEQFKTIEQFRDYWEALCEKTELTNFLKHQLYIEQPLTRDYALDESIGSALSNWTGHPDLIIDESDCCADSLQAALSLGYQGTSHKNCKGVFKSLLNAALMDKYRNDNPSGKFIMSAEDLVNIGPVALLQDLAVISVLGIRHAERNGHHYFRGLDMFPEEVQDGIVLAHPDLYRTHPEFGFPTLDIRSGMISTRSVNKAPFGYAQRFDPACCFTPETAWKFDSLGIYEG